VYRRDGVERNMAITLRGIALVETELERFTDSLAHATEALELTRHIGPPLDTLMALNCLGWSYFRSGQHDLARVNYRQAVDLGQPADSAYETARAMTGLGNVAAAQDDPTEAQRWWDNAEQCYPDLNTVTVGEPRARHARVG
jgi:tetratricopeptide (TPR) repeat protein